jgi:hypothetical protein
MNEEKRKISSTTILLIVGLAFVGVLVIFALFSTPLSPSALSSKGGLFVKFNGNSSLRSNSYFSLDFTIVNVYDVPLENVKVWVEAGRLFSILQTI